MTVLVVTAVKVYADLVAVFLVFLYLLLLLLILWLLHGKTVRSEDTGDILFFDVVDAAAADLVVADSEEADQ